MDNTGRRHSIALNMGEQYVIDEYDNHIDIVAYTSKSLSHIEIPSEISEKPVINICKECFWCHDEIKSVLFPKTLETIGDSAFAMCSGLIELVFPDSVKEIGPRAFRDCKGLQKVVLPSNLKVLRRGVFSFCSLDETFEIEFNEGIEKIEAHAFYDSVNAFFSVELPESVREISVGAFPLGVQIKTSLPYDKGWQMDWPYGETVKKGMLKGHVADCVELHDGCMILDVDYEGKVERLFYPVEFWDGIVAFDKQESKKQVDLMLKESDYVDNARNMYEKWRRGLI